MRILQGRSDQKQIAFIVVASLFAISVLVLFIGILNIEDDEVINTPPINITEIAESEEQQPLSEFFDEIPLTSSKENTELFYLETDPFKEKCQGEGGTYGTACYY